MEEDSSTPTRVFCGPITLEEIRCYLASEKPLEMIGRRTTISDINPSRTIYSDSPVTDYLIKKQFFGSGTDDLSDSFISEYLTANETLHNNDKSAATSNMYTTPCESPQQNSTKNYEIGSNLNRDSQKFNDDDKIIDLNDYACSTPRRSLVDVTEDKENLIVQMPKTLNLSSCRSSLYTSAGECSNSNIHKHTGIPKFSLSQFGKDIRESQNLDQVPDTIVLSSDEDDYENENSSKRLEISNEKSVLETTDENIQKHSSLIYISSGTDSSFEEQIQIKTEGDEQLSQLSLLQQEKSVETIDLVLLESPVSKNLNSEAPSEPHVDYNNSTTNMFCDHDSLNVIERGRSNIPEMAQQTENVSSSSLQESLGYSFNDTLEEMEMALKHGLDYRMPDEVTDNIKTDIPPSDHVQQHEFLYVSNSEVDTDKLSTEWSASKPKPNKKSLIPVKGPQTNSKSHKTITPVKSPFTKQDFNFKVPSKPVVIRKTPDLKSILSPVAVYIKNSPKVPQVQHVSVKPLIAGPLFPKLPSSSVSNKENEELPNTLYKPAKRTIVSKTKELKLPVSVQKYIPNTPAIIKHQGRVMEKKTNTISVEEKLLVEDLTMCDSDASFSNSSLSLQDVSLLTTKKAYIE